LSNIDATKQPVISYWLSYCCGVMIRTTKSRAFNSLLLRCILSYVVSVIQTAVC